MKKTQLTSGSNPNKMLSGRKVEIHQVKWYPVAFFGVLFVDLTFLWFFWSHYQWDLIHTMNGKYFTNTNQELSHLPTLGKKSVLTIWRLPEWQMCSFLSKDKPHTIQNIQTIMGWPTHPTAVTFSILGDFFKLNCLKFTTGNKYILWPSTHSNWNNISGNNV